MAYASRTRAPVPDIVPVELTPEVAGDGVMYDAAALHQDATVVNRKLRQDPAKFASDEKQARQHVLRTLNGLRVIAPALSQALAGEGDEAAQSARFTAIMAGAREFAEAAAQDLELDPTQDRNRWAIGMLERAYMELSGGTEVTMAPQLRQAALEAAAKSGQESQVPEALGEVSTITLALIKAMPPVARAQARFSFYRPDPGQDLRDMAQLVLDAGTQVLQTIVDPVTPAHERQKLLVALVEEGGRLLADSWDHMAKIALRMMKVRTQAELEVWRRAKPEGLPLAQVEGRFRQQMATLGQLIKAPRKRR